jgi:oxygen-independent coproporphyrinogen-3 oxidase
MAGEIGIYVHLPFCLRKCAYCDFDSLPLEQAGGLPAARRYLDALAVELDLRWASEEFHGMRAASIYLGGGTPTVLPAERLTELLARLQRRFPFGAAAEVTVEANPGTVTADGIASLLGAGVNRVSLGVQSFSDDVLRVLGRAHSAAEAVAAVAALRAGGCGNLGVDLIYGVPGQSPDQWQESLGQALALGVEHISTYALSVEPGTRLHQQIESAQLPAPDDELCAQMYQQAADTLPPAGYHHYEISNFARPGQECRHNRRYWALGEYLGLGCSAHSYRSGVRWNNLAGPRVYTECLERGQLPVAQAERLSPGRRLGEALMLGLRRAEGVEEDLGAAAAGVPGLQPRDCFGEEIGRLCEECLLICDGGRLLIPRSKWLVSNEVLSRLVG